MLSSQAYKFKARISLLSTEDGGRRNAVHSGYRPSFAFDTLIHYSGQIELIGNEELRPGQSAHAHIQLLSNRTLNKELQKNDLFTITEGNKIIGKGVIETIE